MQAIVYAPGHTFGEWVIVGEKARDARGINWTVRHACGTTRTMRGTKLRAGVMPKTCRCRPGRRVCGPRPRQRRPDADARHPLYSTWRGMIRRCHEPTAKDFSLYGARGI